MQTGKISDAGLTDEPPDSACLFLFIMMVFLVLSCPVLSFPFLKSESAS